MLVPTHAASAATRTWTGASSSAWSDGGNWVGGTPPVAGDDLVFPGGAPGSVTNDFPAGTSFQSLSFTGTTGTYTLSGNPIVLGAGSLTVEEVTVTTNLNVTLSARQPPLRVFRDDLNK